MVEEKKEDSLEKKPEEEETKENIEVPERGIFKQVKAIEFRMLSPKMIKKMAVAKVVTPELYDKEGYPVDGGLMDIRLGVIDPGLRCKTCGGKLKECPGHFGYMELARPIIHVSFVSIVHIMLSCSCRDCGKVLIQDKKREIVTKEVKKVEKELGANGKRAYI
ncbi:MAG: hypothetical protein QGH47_04965, partial [Candidatus Woesearchaeota archaeon]|nr:hypothetical protein [Candidatus Woesearchaeota archaeon]